MTKGLLLTRLKYYFTGKRFWLNNEWEAEPFAGHHVK